MIWVIANLSILKSVLTDFEFVKCGPAPSTNNKSAFCTRIFGKNMLEICRDFVTDFKFVKEILDRFQICQGKSLTDFKFVKGNP